MKNDKDQILHSVFCLRNSLGKLMRAAEGTDGAEFQKARQLTARHCKALLESGRALNAERQRWGAAALPLELIDKLKRGMEHTPAIVCDEVELELIQAELSEIETQLQTTGRAGGKGNQI